MGNTMLNTYNERQLLPIVLDAVNNPNSATSSFVEVVVPLFDQFLNSDKEKDEYHGWAFDMTFIKASHIDCEPYRLALSSGVPGWKRISGGKDDCTCAFPGKGVIRIHLHSFLWNL